MVVMALYAAPTSAAIANAAGPATNSADRLIMWAACTDVPTLTDAELDLWKSRGVDGFVCMGKQLWGMGGTNNDFTGDPSADLHQPRYAFQRALRDSRIVARANARGMKMYLGARLVNYYNTATPLRDWFDDGGWSGTVLPAMGNLAAAARQLGFAGVAFDQELYKQRGGLMTATWNWNYPGNTRSEQQVRAKATQRGRELMTRLLSAYPGIELMAYDVDIPETWGELVQMYVNGNVNAYARRLDIDFWNGISHVEGYSAIRLVDATFHKTPHVGTWDNAFHYHYNRLYSYLSRRLSNWSYASSRLHVSPFSWINAGPRPSAFDDAKPVSYVAQQLQAFRKWGMGGEFTDYAHGGLRAFDYSPYASAMNLASTPAVVDSQPPALSVADTALQGTTGDNLAIRAVRWTSDRGHAGMARLTWRITSGDPRAGYKGEMLWSIPDLRLEPGDNRITITAEDIKGLTTSAAVTVRGAGSAAPAVLSPLEARRTQPSGGERRVAAGHRARRVARLRGRRRCLRTARSRRSPSARQAAARRCAKRFGSSSRVY